MYPYLRVSVRAIADKYTQAFFSDCFRGNVVSRPIQQSIYRHLKVHPLALPVGGDGTVVDVAVIPFDYGF